MKTIIEHLESSIKKIAKKQKFNFAISDIRYEYDGFGEYPDITVKVHLRKIPKTRKFKAKKKK